MGLKVNTETIEEPVSAGGGTFTFPPVSYRATIEDTEVRDLPGWADGPQDFAQRVNSSNNGWETTDVEILSVRLGQIEPLEEIEDEIGNRKFFVPRNPNSDGLTVRDGNKSIEDANFDPDADDAEYWRLQRAADYVARLADALGQTTEVGGETEIRDGFVDDLASGEFDGMQIGFEVGHFGTYENSNDEEITDQRIVQFFPV